jgi:thioesterase domain-containing protein
MHDASPSHADLLQHLDAHYRAMPPVAAMQLRIAGYDGHRLRLRAPLSLHVNDKGCAFGGSLVSLMTLAGWGLVSATLHAQDLAADVFVADSQVGYLAPLFADLEAEAAFAAGVDAAGFVATLRQRGRARVAIDARVPLPGGGDATVMQARYVAIAKG